MNFPKLCVGERSLLCDLNSGVSFWFHRFAVFFLRRSLEVTSEALALHKPAPARLVVLTKYHPDVRSERDYPKMGLNLRVKNRLTSIKCLSEGVLHLWCTPRDVAL